MSSSISSGPRENQRYHLTRGTITLGPNWRFRNSSGRQDFIVPPYQISGLTGRLEGWKAEGHASERLSS
jgi:hypothetical protein